MIGLERVHGGGFQMNSEDNISIVNRFFKVGTWIMYFSAGVVLLFLILIFSKNYIADQVLIPVSGALLLFHSLWGRRLSRNSELKALIDQRRKNNFWSL